MSESASESRPAARERCGKITDPGSNYPHPCVKPKGHDGECDPMPSRERPAATDFDLCGFRPADTPCWCGWDDEQEGDDE